ncbi:MAG: hypothetical protein HDR17_12465 [Lachnospiraceae bacterium]|nr:hypothetical protein [Lachnospiraceae bacterium]
MKIFMTLYQYELKKIVKRKLIWITLIICIGCIVIMAAGELSGNYYVDGEVVDTHYNMIQVDSAYSRALSGRVVGQELLEEVMEVYSKIPITEGRYSVTEEYQQYARPYSEIFNLVWDWKRSNPLYDGWNVDEQDLYDARESWQEEIWTSLFLSETEKKFWREKETQIDKPFTYFYHEGYSVILKDFEVVGILMLLLTAVCLAGVFPDEHVRRTDQMILSSAKGKYMVYWAKLLAGISVSFICAVVMGVVARQHCNIGALHGSDYSRADDQDSEPIQTRCTDLAESAHEFPILQRGVQSTACCGRRTLFHGVAGCSDSLYALRRRSGNWRT